MKRDGRILAWHFLAGTKKLGFDDDRRVWAGRILRYTDAEPLKLCWRGMHASERPIDALTYAPGPVLCRVELWGDIERGDDKLVGRNRKVLWMMDATALLHEFACRCAVRALKKAKVTDKRCWDAIRAKRRWLSGKATDDDLAAAWAPAWDAAWAAAWAAARAAARDAAWAAARDAARAAAWAAARDAARDAERVWQDRLLCRMVNKARREAQR